MYTSDFVLTTTGRLIDTSRMPRGAFEFDFTTLKWIIPAHISGEEILNGRHLSMCEAARIIRPH